MKKARKSSKSLDDRKGVYGRPEFFLFCDKTTGMPQFKVEAGLDRGLPIGKSASLLAMRCLVRGSSPADYVVMVPAAKDLVDRVTALAAELLEASRAVAFPIRLSRREQEVLAGVLKNLANKEIAARLSLSERTVKFHVSSLLAKFRVRHRVDLIQQAANLSLSAGLPREAALVEFPLSDREASAAKARSRKAAQNIGTKDRVLQLPRPLPVPEIETHARIKSLN